MPRQEYRQTFQQIVAKSALTHVPVFTLSAVCTPGMHDFLQVAEGFVQEGIHRFARDAVDDGSG
jgi:hypothetical protein